MKKFFIRLIKRLKFKYVLYSRYKISNNYSEHISDTVKLSLTICRSLIRNQKSKFLIAPLSGKRYIKNEELGLFIIFDDKRITITNHIYHYDVSLETREWDRIVNMYDNKTEKIRQQFESEIMSQINNSLTEIKNKLKNSL